MTALGSDTKAWKLPRNGKSWKILTVGYARPLRGRQRMMDATKDLEAEWRVQGFRRGAIPEVRKPTNKTARKAGQNKGVLPARSLLAPPKLPVRAAAATTMRPKLVAGTS